MTMLQTKTAEIMRAKAIDIIDRKIADIRMEERPFNSALMEYLRGDTTMTASRFDYNREQVRRCNVEIKVLKAVRRDMVNVGVQAAPPHCERCGGLITTSDDYTGCEECGNQNMEDQ